MSVITRSIRHVTWFISAFWLLIVEDVGHSVCGHGNLPSIQGWIGNTRLSSPGNFFQKSKPSHRSLTQGCALYHSARTFDPSLHYRSFGRSLSLCLHRGLKLSGPLALAAWAKKKQKKRLDSSSAFLHCVMLSLLCPSESDPLRAMYV